MSLTVLVQSLKAASMGAEGASSSSDELESEQAMSVHAIKATSIEINFLVFFIFLFLLKIYA